MQDNTDVQFCNTTNLDNELQKNLEENKNVLNEQVHHNGVQLEENENNNDMLNYIPTNIYDSGNWKNIDTIPFTVASTENFFSKLKLIKSYLRSTMSQKKWISYIID